MAAKEVNKTSHPFDKARFEALLNRRFFYAPAFEIYGGVAGLYDYGPPGSSLQSNIMTEWRKHFIIEDNMSELDTTIMTPAPVFETSGHVARFNDWMVKDLKTGEVIRADHLVKGVLEARLRGDREARGQKEEAVDEKDKKKKKKQAKAVAVKLEDDAVREYETILAQLDNYDGPALGQLCKTHNIRNPDTDNEVSEPVQFNLMFASSIGPTGQHPGYLRPETAQGHFLNFSRLLDYNNGRLPFASAQIGRSFRNEISPRAGLMRVREFNMAEIEHYVDPLDKSHKRFKEVAHIKLALLNREIQEKGSSELTVMSIGEAVEKGIVANETLGYFIARIYLFLIKIGIDPALLRFRQHMGNEMAHYATDCWDAEIKGKGGESGQSFGWTECVGCADRAAYDLSVHMKKTGSSLVVREALKEPIVTEKESPEWNKKEVGKKLRGDAGTVMTIVDNLDEEALLKVKEALAADGVAKVDGPDGKVFEINKDMVVIEKKVFKQSVREYIPNVIEPSFGLGRILYALLEHSFWCREQDIERGVLSLPPVVAPTKVLIVPLSARDEFDPIVHEISSKLRRAGIFSRVDDSNASIGKRYARNDELGTPYGITVDFASIKKGTCTLRERDTTDQRIGTIDEVISTITDLCLGDLDWAGACEKLKEYDGVQDVD